MEINLNPAQLTVALIDYLTSQTNYNKAAISRMQKEEEMMAKRMEMIEEIKGQLGVPGGGGFIDLGALLDDEGDDS